jgi:hypothetical protein
MKRRKFKKLPESMTVQRMEEIFTDRLAHLKFKVEVVYKEVPDKNDRVRQLWDTLVSLPDPDSVKQKGKLEK